MPMLTVDGLTIAVSIDDGIAANFEDLSDRARAINGDLLITQLSGTVGDFKASLPCRTPLVDTATRDTILTKLRSAGILALTGDIAALLGAANAAPVVRSVLPRTLPGPTRRWVIVFDLVEA